jgi:hypothetical protein
MLRLYRTLRREGIPAPFRIAFDIAIKSRFLPHRMYLWSDHDGFIYDPSVCQWYFGPWLIWENKCEQARQRAARSSS